MFHQLALALPGFVGNPTGAANAIFSHLRPSQVSEYLETFWSTGRNAIRQAALGEPIPAGGVVANPAMARAGGAFDPLPLGFPAPLPQVQWHHIVYAYMLENTRMVDIFRRVVHEWLHGELLPTPTEVSQGWLYTTEQLFFGSTWPYAVRSVTSAIRPDLGGTRRNAYYRLLGMDLNHGTDAGTAYPFVKAASANRDFAAVMEALIAEVWRGYTNRLTVVAQNITDDNAIVNLVRRLREMLRARRLAGALAREEFDAVATLDWFYLAVRYNTQIVMDLNALADGVADRLKKIGERVGLPAHTRSDAYFQLAEPLSNVLLGIEGGAVFPDADWPLHLYGNGGLYTNDMLQIITHWSIATGRDVKDLSMRPTAGTVLAGTGAGQSGISLPQNGRVMAGVR